ncbi:hypothetical protein RGR602_CH03226 [Rhizobium gallicum bv. gallicum R602sp]|uniref:Uncharacterized protein n=1 Tax=Rhizobium gallicum bv. gallicum R602sp TaxID=1041138 RepID=A0A0B4X7T8_9HYPH|nr:hypothetical protein RGR602_CH03226 [Rhizobium gallicum bv. gallicum R602sp]
MSASDIRTRPVRRRRRSRTSMRWLGKWLTPTTFRQCLRGQSERLCDRQALRQPVSPVPEERRLSLDRDACSGTARRGRRDRTVVLCFNRHRRGDAHRRYYARERFLWPLVETLPAMIDCAAPNGEPVCRSQQIRDLPRVGTIQPDGHHRLLLQNK